MTPSEDGASVALVRSEPLSDEPVQKRSIRELTLRSVKRTHEMFAGMHTSRPPLHESSAKLKMAIKVRAARPRPTSRSRPTRPNQRLTRPPSIHPPRSHVRSLQIRDDYQAVRNMAPPEISSRTERAAPASADDAAPSTSAPASATPPTRDGDADIPGLALGAAAKKDRESDVARLIDAIDDDATKPSSRSSASDGGAGGAIVEFRGGAGSVAPAFRKTRETSASLIPRLASKWPKPEWHAPWKLYRVISGHQGWVRSVTVDPSNEWFVTGSADRTIKIWDLASGQLKLTLTGHIEQVTGLAVSDRHPYMFSCGLDKMVKCWDLEYNKVIRHYHGHLSGVYSLALHPELDVLMTGGRDSACRVWDMRTKLQAMCLTGHDNTVGSIVSQRDNPQVITGSYDSTVKLWDLAAGKCKTTLTYHKKGVRALALHPREFTLLSASADNIKKFGLPDGTFMHNMLSQQKSIVNALAVNEDDVVVSGGDNGSLWFWDYKSGHCFQQAACKVQPGSMESEAGVFAATFDRTGTRLITVEADKTIKMWKQDEDASPETHPNLPFHPPRDLRRF